MSDCRVYWSSHGCEQARGHRGPHVCECGDSPGRLVRHDLFGEDAPLYCKVRSVWRHGRLWGWRTSWRVLRGKA